MLRCPNACTTSRTAAGATMPTAIADSDVLLVVDVQNDFCPGGKLAVPHGDEVVPPINRLADRFRHVILTHPGKRPFETVAVDYGQQILWPDHCVQGTLGAQFHDGLQIPHAELVLRKGFRPTIDSYSALYENDRKTPTGLAGYLRERGLTRIFIAGLAFDFCVRYSAEDARREDFAVTVIEDACRAIDVGGSLAATRASFARLEIATLAADAIA